MSARKLESMLGEPESGTSFYRALADQIRLLVIDGRIPVGTRLPSERDLSATLHRSRSTVVATYGLLRDTGYLRSRQGSGSVVSLPSTPLGERPIDFAHAVPAPIPGIGDYIRRGTADLDRILAAPGFDLVGDEVLRSRLAERYSAGGLATGPAEVLITVGAQQAIGAVARAVLRRGDRVLMDSPCYPHAYEAFHSAGARVVTTPVTRNGWDVDHLVELLHRTRPTAAYLMPDFQNPTGASLPADARSAIVEAAARVGTTHVVDETTADLGIDRNRIEPPFAHLAARHHADVITVGSLSKSIWGGLRLGWVRAPRSTVDRLQQQRPAYDLGTPILDQLVAAEIVPDLPALLPVRSAQLRESRDRLVSQLRSALPEWDVVPPEGGLSLWVGLDHPVASSLAVLTRTQGMSISAGPRFTLDGSHERFLRLPFTESDAELARGVGILGEAWATLEHSGHRFAPGLGTVV
jgi:DNA-binding transcriptional MocR family regulator